MADSGSLEEQHSDGDDVRGSPIKTSPTDPGDISSNSRPGSVSPVEQIQQPGSSAPVKLMERLTLDRRMTESVFELISLDERNKFRCSGEMYTWPPRRFAGIGLEQNYDPQPVTWTTEMGSKHGKAGTPITLLANYFGLQKNSDWALYQHQVTFQPVEDQERFRKWAISLHTERIGVSMFNGETLYTVRNLAPVEPLVLLGKHNGYHDAEAKIIIRFMRKVEPEDPIYRHFYNLIVRTYFGMDLCLIGKNFYDTLRVIRTWGSAHPLTLWPGFATEIRINNEDVMLCVDTIHKVLHEDTNILLTINRLKNQKHQDFKKAVSDEVVGKIVVTNSNYFKKTYLVDGIDWTVSPSSTFDWKGVATTYADYYKNRWGIYVWDMEQPLLVVKPDKLDKNEKYTGSIYLAPENCQMTGISDAMRANIYLMVHLFTYLHLRPTMRVTTIVNFMKRLQATPEIAQELDERGLKFGSQIAQELDEWGLKFSSQLTECQGRLMVRESLVFGGSKKWEVARREWALIALRCQQMFATVKMDRWIILVPDRLAWIVDKLVTDMVHTAEWHNFILRPPLEVIDVSDDQPATSVMQEAINKYAGDLQMVFVILPKKKLKLYSSSVKQLLSSDAGISSQFFLTENFDSEDIVKIIPKVVVEMNTKLGGEPWSIQIDLKNLMFVGVNVHHELKRNEKSIGAMVSTTSATFGSYFSTVSTYSGREELATNLSLDIEKSLQAYQQKNDNEMPERIIVFRDGVNEEDVGFVFNIELEQLKEALLRQYTKEGKEMPLLTFIVVNSKINTKLFTASENPDNPPPGTVLDDVITYTERYDFFLVSQFHSASTGTVSPSYYNVLFDSQKLDVDQLQRITYQMCHMNFGSYEIGPVPAPCEYSRKLATLAAVELGSKPVNPKLQHLLHFL